MARLPRLSLAGHPHLLEQRGRPGLAVFADDDDRRLYIDLVVRAASRLPVAVHAYVLVDDGALLVVTPGRPEALARLMQGVGRGFSAHVRRRDGRPDTPWNGRFRSAVVESEHYLLDALLFVEQAAVRAGLAITPGAWPWSSAGHHTGARRDAWVADGAPYWNFGNTPFERQARYAERLLEPLAAEAVADLEAALRGGWPLGSAAFIAAMAEITRRRLRPSKPGRKPVLDPAPAGSAI